MVQKLLISLSLILLVVSCQSDSFESKQAAEFYDESIDSQDNTQAQTANTTSSSKSKETFQPRKVILNAHLNLEVKDLNLVSEEILAYVENAGGYLSSSNRSSTDYQDNQQLVLKVKSDAFKESLDFIKSKAVSLDQEKITSRDVTEEFIDIESRLKSKKVVRDRYQVVLKDKAKTVEEVLLAENSILKIQEEIEAKEGRLIYLKNQVAMSTIILQLYQELDYKPIVAAYSFNFFGKVKNAAIAGWHFVLYVIIALVGIWPLLLIATFVYFLRKPIMKMLLAKT